MSKSIKQSMPEAFSERLQAQVDAFGIPGIVVALVVPGQRIVWTHGEDALGSGRPVTAQTWFSVASVGKHVTGVAVLDLAQRGLVDLGEPIGRYLMDVPVSWAGRSILSLLRHTSGLPEYLSNTLDDAVLERRDDFMLAFADLQPLWGEGEAWMYSNTNYILLGFLIAQLTGVSYGVALQRFFDDVGCCGVAVSSSAWARAANEAGTGVMLSDRASMSREVIGDGDISFNADGAAAWMEVLVNGAGLDESRRNLMVSAPILKTGRPSHYGCGWFVDRIGDMSVCHHSGHFDGWTAMTYMVPSRGCAVMVMCNIAPGNTRAVRYLAQLALEEFAPGLTSLSLEFQRDDAPSLTACARAQLVRQSELDRSCFAEEMLRVATEGGPVRDVINLWAGREPLTFTLLEAHACITHVLRRYRLTYLDRVEHLLVGTTPAGQIYWAWPI